MFATPAVFVDQLNLQESVTPRAVLTSASEQDAAVRTGRQPVLQSKREVVEFTSRPERPVIWQVGR